VSKHATTTIEYSIPTRSDDVRLVISDLMGRTVRTLQTGTVETPGVLTADWDAKDMNGNMVPSGTYVITLRATQADGKFVNETMKISLEK
jgi:flagellar basal-body rod modification protein FlgD